LPIQIYHELRVKCKVVISFEQYRWSQRAWPWRIIYLCKRALVRNEKAKLRKIKTTASFVIATIQHGYIDTSKAWRPWKWISLPCPEKCYPCFQFLRENSHVTEAIRFFEFVYIINVLTLYRHASMMKSAWSDF